ncbi:hypothetical protein QQP08_000649 [Theobroma cacao]|nr:hypothetical protein QQP08_000649 [Theobroma cacao]
MKEEIKEMVKAVVLLINLATEFVEKTASCILVMPVKSSLSENIHHLQGSREGLPPASKNN